MDKKPTFEERLSKLDNLVKDLETDLPLEKAMLKYEEGIKLATECEKDLKQAEKKILKMVDDNGEPKLVPITEHEFPTLF